MKPKLASSILTGLLYAQGLLGFAGLATVAVKEMVRPEPVFVVGMDTVAPAR